MCDHVSLTTRAGVQCNYSLMDCSTKRDGRTLCVLTDEAAAHLMASGQFTAIQVSDDKQDRHRSWREEEFPAFIEKVLGAAALSQRHHAPEAIGKLVR